MARDHERYRASRRVSLWGALVNLALSILKMVFGVLGHSSALFADGVHSLSDLICNGFVLVAARIGSVDADHNHPYGHRRIETFATFALGIMLMIVASGIGFEAISRLLHPTVIAPRWDTLVVAFLSIVANEALFFYSLAVAKRIRSDLMRANAYHNRGDSLTSVIVLIGLVGSYFGWHFLDPLAALVVTGYILHMGISWSLKAVHELTDLGLSDQDLQKIADIIRETEGVLHMHKLRTRTMAEQVFLDVHILVSPYSSASEGHYIAECVRVALAREFSNMHDVTVHVDIEDHPEGIPTHLPPSRSAIETQMLPEWEKVVPLSAIQEIRLFYFGLRAEVEVKLNLNELKSKNLEAITEAFQHSSESMKGLREVRVVFG